MNAKDNNRAGSHIIRQPMNKKGIANLLGVSTFILKKWIEAVKADLGEPIGTLYSVNQVNFLVSKYGAQSEADSDKEVKS